jgi:hypothetical protein
MTIIENEQPESAWQESFLAMLPEIRQRLDLAFCRLNAEARDDAIEESVVHCLISYARLHERDRANSVTASSLAWYSSRQVKRGRTAVGRLNCNEPLSRYALIGHAIQAEPIQSEWIDVMATDKKASVVDQAIARIDVSAWFASLSRRLQKIARDLAFGFTTSEVAQKHGVTPGRISQLRRRLEESWMAFQS